MSLPVRSGVPKRRLERLEGLRRGKRQAWTPIKSYWWGPGAFACGVRGAKKAFGAFGRFEAWQTAGVNAKKKLLMGPCCLCLRGWGCQKGVWSVWRVWGLANGRRERQEKAKRQGKAIDGALLPLPAGLGVPKRRPGKPQAWTPIKSDCWGKRQAWTPRKSYWCGLGGFAFGVGGAKKAFGAFGVALVSLPAGLGKNV